MKKFLFVDDDAGFLATIAELFAEMGRESWEIFTAENHAQALDILQKERVEVVVLDIGMPVLDGFQFLRLVVRAHPGQQVVMLTGQASDERRQASLENGAALLLEKPVTAEGYNTIFSALDALAGANRQTGFRGMMRQVGLQEVLQMECLGRKSSILEIFTQKTRGRIYIREGTIVHADSGALQGETALYGLLALQDGEFNLHPFTEPPRRTIQGSWEFLLMEAARLTDEGTQFFKAAPAKAQPFEGATTEPVAATIPDAATFTWKRAEPAAAPPPPVVIDEVRIEEILLCSGSGEVLYELQCTALDDRLRLLEQVEQQATQLSSLAPLGRFDRMEILIGDGRVVCQVQPDRRLFVRSARSNAEIA